jgi:hypothetical protein
MVIVKEDNKREKNYPSVSLFHYGVRDIFIFGGGNKRLRNVTNLYCQCQISQRRS